MTGMTIDEIAEASEGAVVRQVDNKITVSKDDSVSKLDDIYSYVYHCYKEIQKTNDRLKRMETKLTAFLKGETFEQKLVPKIPERPQLNNEDLLRQEQSRRISDNYWRDH